MRRDHYCSAAFGLGVGGFIAFVGLVMLVAAFLRPIVMWLDRLPGVN